MNRQIRVSRGDKYGTASLTTTREREKRFIEVKLKKMKMGDPEVDTQE